jgi:hypothetical protein
VAVSALKLYEGLPEKYGGLKPTAKPPLPVREPPFFKPPPDATPERLKELEEFRKAFIARQNRPPRITDVNFRVNFIEIMGPFEQRSGASPESRGKIFACGHLDGGHNAACERKIVSAFARRAYRRPAKPGEIDRLVARVAEPAARRSPASRRRRHEARQVSPHFLFRIERPTARPARRSGASHQSA